MEFGINKLVGAVLATIFNVSTLKIFGASNNSLSGRLPSSPNIRLSNLEKLHLWDNNFSGTIPSFIFNASKLSTLELQMNSFSGFIPNTVGNLRNLGLNDNYLTSSTPELSFLSSLSNCEYLEYLSFSDNPLDGILPRAIGNLSQSMENIWMSNCNSSGSIPDEISNLTNLIAISLEGNKLNGSIPIALRKLQKLQLLSLKDNQLEGSIPNDLCRLVALFELDLGGNKLVRFIPACFGNLTNLRNLYLGSNKLTSIPSTLWNLKDILRLDLSSNFFTGPLPSEIGNLKVLTKRAKQRSSSLLLSETDTVPDMVESSNDSEEQVMDRAAPVERTLRELAEPDLNKEPLCIQYVNLEFLEKYFPTSRAANIRKDICGIRQLHGETLTVIDGYEYDRCYQWRCAGEQDPYASKELISNMAANAQQFGSRQDPTSRKVNEVNISSVEQRLDKLTSLMEKFVVVNVQQVKTCGICSNMGHSTYICPTLQEELVEQANAVGGFPSMPQRRYDPYAQTYNPGWKDHPNFSYGVRPSGFPQQYPPRQPAPPQSNSKSGISLEEIIKSLATNTQQFQHATTTIIQNLENQMSQLATTMSRLESQVSRRLPSQSEVNPKQNASAVILRSGKELQEPDKKVTKHVEDELEKNELMPKSQDAQPTRAKPLPVVIPPPFSKPVCKIQEGGTRERHP
ncbi:protein kinase domain-containing protein [Citrus sinensis]|uniref:Protein kinase domain-containing protein n=1 Tax=Citrus sinensis TaxID=2711 RepID=A0ACB8JF36_CITSI|nr:protein kinase domain-containing protein [Citrus sinensis]